jgi:hypothetical protein
MKLCHEPKYLAGHQIWPGQELHFCKRAGDCSEPAATVRQSVAAQPSYPATLFS